MNTNKNVDQKLLYTGMQKILPSKPAQKAKELNTFIVTHKSVVATLLLVVEEEHRLLRIWWGDEGENTLPLTIDVRRERLVASNETLPRNTFKFQHRYEENTPNRKIILVQAIDDKGKSVWNSRVIEIDPLYKFICYPMILEVNGHFDSLFESYSEFEIDMTVSHNNTNVFVEHWNENVQTLIQGAGIIFPVYATVEGSNFSVDIAHSDAPIYMALYIKEDDNALKDVLKLIANFPVGFDSSTRVPSSFHPSTYTGSKDFRVPYDLKDGRLTVILRTEMRLEVPLDPPNEFVI